jgi:hypothetical protein
LRLLNVHTLEMREFFEDATPPYFILSHRWGPDEVSNENFSSGKVKETAGYRKILYFCKLAKERNAMVSRNETPGRTGYAWQTIDWVWADTCCIDKRSSAELSEAINSMYRWYERAIECVVFLADVPPPTADSVDRTMISFKTSSWFTRGWALQ